MSIITEFFRIDGQRKGSLLLTLALSTVLFIMAYAAFTYIPSPEYRYNPGEPEKTYHPDEGVWTAAGKYYFQKFFLERDWSYQTWSDPRFGAFGTSNPVMGKYLIGFSLFSHGVVDRENSIPGYEFEKGFNWETAESVRPEHKILKAARYPMLLTGALSCVLLFLLVRRLSGSLIIGLGASILFVLQPQVIVNSQQVLMDMPVLFFSLLCLFLASGLIRGIWKKKLGKVVWTFVIIGLSFGLALQTKLNSMLVLFIFVLWLAVELLFTENQSTASWYSNWFQKLKQLMTNSELRKRAVLSGVVFGLSFGILFFSLNPYLYQDTFRNTKQILRMGKRVANMDVPEAEKNNTLMKKWNSLIHIGLDRSGVFRYWLGTPAFVDKLLASLGVIYGLALLYYTKNTEVLYGHLLMGIWFVIIGAGLLAWIPFNWPRWYLPMTPVWATLETIGIITLWNLSSVFLKRLVNNKSGLVSHK